MGAYIHNQRRLCILRNDTMTYYAKVVENKVHNVIKADDAYIAKLEDGVGRWIKMEGKAASPGWTYDAVNDIFIGPKPFPSWYWDAAARDWKPPTPKPDGKYRWDEATKTWVSFAFP